ncbi:hypothetical protein GKE82_22030 [Conexibacter sp. W3-3-2]|uniref:hypothetical protein n=1 Tax=Conexibacter sp. W3-3-2 TaxID=2675227 RepID=UPI0012B8746A|nr:hypothetical protein [Conexibacter sp. W3-3-2]MTD46895.1 hypothetical protein [Conexibacter sp. W3-3-2]
MSEPAGAPLPHFKFVQLEFPWELGPEEGRYVVRGHAGEVDQVVVLQTLGAPERRGLVRNRRARDVPSEPPATPVPVSRVTVVGPKPFPSLDDAARWRREVDGEEEAAEAIRVLNRMLHLHRTATADPTVREVSRPQTLVVRVGTGEGEQLAHSRWAEAVELPPQARRRQTGREAALRPQERLAALLGGRDVALACEELILRARLDLDGDRTREAALQLRVALEAAIAELAPWADRAQIADRLEALRAERRAVGAAANRALEGGLDEETVEDVRRVVGLVEGIVRLRTSFGFG